MDYFTSDTHIGDRRLALRKDLITYPFKSMFQRDNLIRKNFNSVIGENDTLYILGDFASNCSVEYAKKMLRQFNGKKILIVGNHDAPYLVDKEFRDMFATIEDNLEICCKGVKLYLSHEFDENWTAGETIHLYGHYHYGKNPEMWASSASLKNGAYNVGVSFYKYHPVCVEEIYKKAHKDFYSCETNKLGGVSKKTSLNVA